jgi:hypothetical protein
MRDSRLLRIVSFTHGIRERRQSSVSADAMLQPYSPLPALFPLTPDKSHPPSPDI